jgi:hypothetical protein
MAPILNFQKKAGLIDRQAVDVYFFQKRCFIFCSKNTTFAKESRDMEFLFLSQHKIGPKSTFWIDLTMAASEDDSRPFIFPPCPADKPPDIPFSTARQCTGIDDYNISLFQGTV